MNVGSRKYDYFETPEGEPWHAPAPPAARSPSSLGAVPEDAAWPLPAGARYAGSGAEARGRIAVSKRGGSAGGMGDVEPAFMVGAAVAAMVGGLALLVRSGR